MRTLNLKVALGIYGALYITQGIVLVVAPERAADLSGFIYSASFVPYFLTLIGATFIAAGVWFALSALDPLRNMNGIRFAVLWAALLLIIPIYALGKDYVDFSQVWPGVVENAIFIVAFLVFYPYRRQRED